jgi:hypothetical protein
MVRMLTALAALLLLGAAGCTRTADPDAGPPSPQTTPWAAIVDRVFTWRPAHANSSDAEAAG